MSNKKRKKQPKKKSSNNKIIYIFLSIFLFAFLAASVSYYIMQKQSTTKTITKKPEPLQKEEPKTRSQDAKDFDKEKVQKHFEEKKDETINQNNYEEITEELKKDVLHEKAEPKIEEKKDKVKIVEKTAEKKVEKKPISTPKYDEKTIVTDKDLFKYNGKEKPKLAIVIDDVTTSSQKQRILDLGYKVTMAFLPPTSRHKNSAKIAQNLPFKMIHFPMQASPRFKGAEEFTLNINDSYEKIEKRVAQLRAWYPDVKYTNNHTGSIFTQDEVAMDRLFKALKKHNFIFVDSRTSSKSVAKKYAKKYGMPYIVRNTFLDNEKDFNYIQTQLKKAITSAKKHGYAIAIGHPYNITTEVLAKSKHLLKDVETIYINELPYLK